MTKSKERYITFSIHLYGSTMTSHQEIRDIYRKLEKIGALGLFYNDLDGEPFRGKIAAKHKGELKNYLRTLGYRWSIWDEREQNFLFLLWIVKWIVIVILAWLTIGCIVSIILLL